MANSTNITKSNLHKYITSLGYKPTINDLSKRLNLNDSITLKTLKEFGLTEYINITNNRDAY